VLRQPAASDAAFLVPLNKLRDKCEQMETRYPMCCLKCRWNQVR
jgi:hypothetical protein